MTYEQFRKAYPARRIFQHYNSEQRANHASSHRLSQRQRSSVGEFFYEHDLVPDLAFPTAKDATTRAYKVFMSQRRIEVVEDQSRLRIEDEDLSTIQSAQDGAEARRGGSFGDAS